MARRSQRWSGLALPATLVVLAACERRVVPTPDPIVPGPVPAPAPSASEAPAPSAASMAVPVPPGCSFVPLGYDVTFRDDLRWLAAAYDPEGGNDIPTYYAVELNGGAAAHVLKGTFEGSSCQHQWTPDGRTLVTFTNFHTGRAELELWDTTKWTMRATADVYCSMHAEISGDGSWLGAVGCNGFHVVLETRAGARAESWLRDPMRTAGDVDISSAQSPDSKAWLVTDHDGQVELFGVHPLRLRRVVVKPNLVDETMTPVAWSPSSRAFATAESDGAIRIWDAATGAPRRVVRKPLGKHGEHPTALAWGSEGVLATAEVDGTVHLWDAARGAPAGTLGAAHAPADPGEHRLVTLSFLGKDRVRLCTGPYEKQHLTVFERSSGRALFERDGCGVPSPDGARLFFEAPGHIEIADAGTGVVQRRVDVAQGAEGVQWTGGGRFVTWMEGAPLHGGGWSGHTLRALRVVDGAELWMALLDGPDGPRLTAQGEGGAYAGPSPACLPGPPTGSVPSPSPGLVAAFFAGGS